MLLLVGVLVVAVALARASLADNEHPACQRHADLLDRDDHLLGFTNAKQARSDLEAELKEDPDAGCAARGLARLSARNCEAGQDLLRQALLNRAEKVFVAELEVDAGSKCAGEGLRQVAHTRCRIARRLHRNKLTAKANEILKSESLPDVPAVCPFVPRGQAQPKQKPKPKPKPKPDDEDD